VRRFSITIFLSAFLLFQIQPLISKRILPWFGGSPAVWTTCMLSFQLLLLGGYVYAHLISTRLAQRRQVITHLAVLGLAVLLLLLLFLPLFFGGFWKPAEPGEPVLRIAWLLAATVGLPFFALSSTSPLLQKWYLVARPQGRVYRLYSLSNVGSLLALVTFPVVMEPFLSTRMLAVLWAIGFLAFVLLCAGSALGALRSASHFEPRRMAGPSLALDGAAGRSAGKPEPDEPVQYRVWLLWLLLPACASVMLLAVTNEICQDVAVMPFLWVLPLGLYLLSFIICFDSERWYYRPVFWPLMALMVALMCRLRVVGADASIVAQVGGYALGLFACAMVCHGELVRLRPGPRRLTAFYLMVAAGGALGGIFVTLVAPLIFKTYAELNVGIWLSTAVALAALWHSLPAAVEPAYRRALNWGSAAIEVLGVIGLASAAVMPIFVIAVAPFSLSAARWISKVGAGPTAAIGLGVAAALVAIGFGLRASAARLAWFWLRRASFSLAAIGLIPLGAVLLGNAFTARNGCIMMVRNFYGILRVLEMYPGTPELHSYTLMHGRIKHGVQYTGSLRRTPVSYYGRDTGIGLAIEHYPRESGIRLGMVGLGTGTVAAYGRKGDEIVFYEINADVLKLAMDPFTYLADSQASCRVVMGDARLSLEREPPDRQFDILALDAFSGDAIPMHLLTGEAFEVYLRHMKPGGIIAVHISNRHLDLEPVVAGIAERIQWQMVSTRSKSEYSELDANEEIFISSDWVLLTQNERFLALPEIQAAANPPEDHPPCRWTDDFSDIFTIVRWR